MSKHQVGPSAIGRRIAQLRESSGMKQIDLATKIKWSQAVLSRAEAGERQLTEEEISLLTEGIGSAEARKFGQILGRQWKHIEMPALDHGDNDLLWSAEEVLERLHKEANGKGFPQTVFGARMADYDSDIRGRASLVMRRDHQVAFIGAIGAGKSTAICRATGLEHGDHIPVLETGAGGITLCDVSIKVGPGFGMVVLPRAHESVRNDISDFADQIFRKIGKIETVETTDEPITAVPREIERAIRNMSDLRPTRISRPDGKKIRYDPAENLALNLQTPNELVVELLTRINMHDRTRSEVWFDGISHEDPMEWVAETFMKINNGRHPEFPLPTKVDVIMPSFLEFENLSTTLTDTRGIDGISVRADLEERLLDPMTISLLCSGFNDAPEQAVQHLLERARTIGNPQIDTHAAILVLPRVDEALKMKDESGDIVDSIEEGYELREEQVANALSTVQLGGLDIEFYNAMSDPSGRLTSFIEKRIFATRAIFRENLTTVVAAAEELLDNFEKEQVLEAQQQVAKQIQAWIELHQQPKAFSGAVHDTLIKEMKRSHASTINASVRREGEWDSLSFSYQLGFGARQLAVASLGDYVTGLREVCQTAAVTHPEAAELLGQVTRLATRAYDDLLKKLQLAGRTLYRDQLKQAKELWQSLSNEWGRGSGYKERVSKHQSAWFADGRQNHIDDELRRILEREWQFALGRIAGILDL